MLRASYRQTVNAVNAGLAAMNGGTTMMHGGSIFE
jgi:hypothetical protein